MEYARLDLEGVLFDVKIAFFFLYFNSTPLLNLTNIYNDCLMI